MTDYPAGTAIPLRDEPCRMPVGRWIPHFKGKPNSSAFEIVVIREDNEHGLKSYGWIDPNKLLVTHDGGPSIDPINQRVWDLCWEVAKTVAAELNHDEERSV